MSAVALAIVAGVGALGSLGVGIGQNSAAKKRARAEEAKAKRAERKLELLEKRRKAPIDNSEQIRGMKDQIFNPYANLGVAMQATNLQLEATDEDLANTLNSINASGTSAGGATALAKMAAQSKAQVAAGLEKQELKNQELRISGEMQVQQQKQALEMQALQEEITSLRTNIITPNDINSNNTNDDDDFRLAENARKHVNKELRAQLLCNQHEISGDASLL